MWWVVRGVVPVCGTDATAVGMGADRGSTVRVCSRHGRVYIDRVPETVSEHRGGTTAGRGGWRGGAQSQRQRDEHGEHGEYEHGEQTEWRFVDGAVVVVLEQRGAELCGELDVRGDFKIYL